MNVHALTEDESCDTKERFCEQLEHVFNQFLKYHMKILLGNFHAKVGREDIFKPTIRSESLSEISSDNGVRVVNFARSKIVTLKSTVFPHYNILKYIRTFPDGETIILTKYYYRYEVKEDEMDGTCSMHWRREMCTVFSLENLKERDHSEGLDVGRKIILEWFLGK
jgi:hypothetical protein